MCCIFMQYFQPKVFLKTTASILEKSKGNFCEGVGYKLETTGIEIFSKKCWYRKPLKLCAKIKKYFYPIHLLDAF